MRRWLLALAMVLWASGASAATYYVRTDGNNANAGTANTSGGAWLTIQKCADTIAAGDLCVVGNGAYTETVTVSRSGTSGNLLTFLAATPRSVALTGKFVLTGDYLHVEGFAISVPNGSSPSGISVAGTANVLTNNSVTYPGMDSGGEIYGLYFGSKSSNSTATRNYIEKSCYGAVVAGTGHTLDGNEFNAMQWQTGQSCSDLDYTRVFGASHTLRNNYMHGVNMATRSPAHVDCIQNFDDNHEPALVSFLFENNRCSEMDEGVMLGSSVWGESENVLIRNNVFYRPLSWCAQTWRVTNLQFFNNVCDLTDTGNKYGLIARGSSGSVEFKNNIIYGADPVATYGVYTGDAVTIIDGTAENPGKNNLLYTAGQTITGYANDIKNSDPLFVDISTRDYRLQSGSPGKDAGLTISGWTTPTDLSGVPRPQGSEWDIGAYEYYAARPAAPSSVAVVTATSLQIQWTHAGTLVGWFQTALDSGTAVIVRPTPSGTTYQTPLPYLSPGAHTLDVSACNAVGCVAAPRLTIVKL
jgi:hypothetical protein